MSVHQLVYYSRNTITKASVSPWKALKDIILKSQANNRRDDITGYLIFDKVCFLQVLEGDRDKVRTAYRRIEGDVRHCDLVILGARDVAHRSFADWTMAGALRTPEQDSIFIEHGIGSTIIPARLKADRVVSLAVSLARFHAFSREGGIAADDRSAAG